MPNKILSVILIVLKYLHYEYLQAMGYITSPGITHIFISVFLFIAINNRLGLLPYVFTSSRHLVFTFSLGIPLWLGFIIISIIISPNNFLSHLVPIGTPYILMPFMVIIELISTVIRPLTLSVRLAANIVAGHLLLVLVRSPIASSPFRLVLVIFLGLLLLCVLEVAVSLIQAYVFSTLTSLYVIEVNSPYL